ncbi:MAG: T9SS type A sorting domain-containing protein [bacterium]|nr:MAG: T9SS type A sorting domain-containing protein [bacterium]
MLSTLKRALVVFFVWILAVSAGVAPSWSANLLGLTDTGEFFSSEDGGVTWSVVASLPASDAIAIAAGEENSELYLATQSGVVYRSSDAGLNWAAVGTTPSSDLVDMAIRTNGDVFLLTETGTLWQSQDGGVTFSAVSALTASNHVSLTGDAGGGNMYALTKTGEVARSTDFGLTWVTVGTITTSEAVDIRTVGQTVYVLMGSGDVARSTDNGTSWFMVGTVSQVHMTGLTSHGGQLAAVTKEGLVAVSSDATIWTFVGSINQLNVVAIGNDVPTITDIPSRPTLIPTLSIEPPWPNPLFTDAVVNIAFDLPSPDVVELGLYDVAGRRLGRRAPELITEAGRHKTTWVLPSLPSGTYFLRLDTASGARAARRIVILH